MLLFVCLCFGFDPKSYGFHSFIKQPSSKQTFLGLFWLVLRLVGGARPAIQAAVISKEGSANPGMADGCRHGWPASGLNQANLLGDVYDDMMLDVIQPLRDTFHLLIVGAMKGNSLHNAPFFHDEMKADLKEIACVGPACGQDASLRDCGSGGMPDSSPQLAAAGQTDASLRLCQVPSTENRE
ncbi:hypothetical protein KSP39_PZI001899 [Platanthera zijinensis]|uniref:Uncharacterized protein n=1 Tax=Platanthera zijinensis TaxID=2320716 RepID=A0AAP0BZI3_9ASPA